MFFDSNLICSELENSISLLYLVAIKFLVTVQDRQYVPKCAKMSDHEKTRRSLCGVCGKKASNLKPLTEEQVAIIRKEQNPNYDLKDPHFPLGICATCRQHKVVQGKRLEVGPNFALVENIARMSRGTCKCSCLLCQRVSYFGKKQLPPLTEVLPWPSCPVPLRAVLPPVVLPPVVPPQAVPSRAVPLTRPPGTPSKGPESPSSQGPVSPCESLTPILSTPATPIGIGARIRPCRMSAVSALPSISAAAASPASSFGSPSQSRPRFLRRCQSCFAEVEPCEKHTCGSTACNVLEMLATTSRDVRRQIAATLLRDEAEAEDAMILSTGQRQIRLPNPGGAGPPITVTYGAPKKSQPKPRIISGQEILDLQNKLDASNTAMLEKIIPTVRKALGKKSVEAGVKTLMKQRSDMLMNLYTAVNEKFVTKTDGRGNPVEVQERPFVYANLPSLIQFINKKRGNNPQHVLNKVMVDSGRGFLKVCISVIPFNLPRPCNNKRDMIGVEDLEDLEDSDDSDSSEDKHTEKPQCKGDQSLGKVTGVNRLILVAIVPDVPEHRHNLGVIFDAIGLDGSNITFVADMKVLSPVLGLQGFTAATPCLWCDAERDHLDTIGNPRTFGSLRANHAAFMRAGGRKETAKKFQNSLNPPMLTACDDDKPVIDVIPVPPLHNMIGDVNILYRALGKTWGEENILMWAQAIGVGKEAYHGQEFAGNACRKLLRNKSLQVLREMANGNQKVLAFADTFASLNDIVHECFGMHYDSQVNHWSLIDKFRRQYITLDAPITPKIHATFFHILEFMERKNDNLGLYTEQAGETVHYKWTKTWERFARKLMRHGDYLMNLKQAVSDFSGKHL